MAHLIPQEHFEELVELAGPLITRAREVCRGEAVLWPGTSEEQTVLAEEASALSVSMMAVARTTPLDERSMFVAMGATIGVLMAQGLDNHADLWKVLRDQLKQTYDEMIEATRPRGGVQ